MKKKSNNLGTSKNKKLIITKRSSSSASNDIPLISVAGYATTDIEMRSRIMNAYKSLSQAEKNIIKCK